MSATVRLGIVGAGGIVEQRHLPGFAAIDGVEVRAVANRSVESAQAVADRWSIPEAGDDWRALVARDDIDAVVIGTWPYLHRDVTLAALAAGKHVFCQARMARNAAEAREMYEAAALSDRVTALCPPPHAMPVERLVRRLLAKGALGDLRLVRVTALSAGATDEQRPATWRERAGWSGQNALTLGIWAEIVRGWAGETRSVQALLNTYVPCRPDAAGGSYELAIPDSLAILSEFTNGAQGVWQFSSVAHCPPPESVELYGSAGTMRVVANAASVWLGRAGDTALSEVPVPADLANPWQVEANFIAALRGEEPVLTSFADGLRYMEFVEAVYRAHSVGATVRLPLGP